MADMIQCPVCGAENPPNQKICQRCQTPLTNDASLKPGQSPVHKDTGELEGLLPQWLKDARQSAKAETPAEQPPQLPKDEPLTQKTAAPKMDFLAGPSSKQKPDEAETSGIRWVETGSKTDFHQGESAEEEVPAWLAGMQSPQPGAEEKDELTDWFRESGAQEQSSQQGFQEKPQQTPPFDSSFAIPPSEETPDWLKQMAADAGEKEPEPPADTSFGSSDWFSQPPADSSSTPSGQPSETPDWLKQMQSDVNASSQPQASAEPFAFSSDADTPDWVNQMQADNSAEQAQTPEPFGTSSETPDWLSSLGSVSGGEAAPFAESTPAESEPLVSGDEIPSWLAPEQDAAKKTDSKPRWLQSEEEAATGTPAWLASEQPASETPAQDDMLGDLPDWLKSAAPESTIFDEPAQTVEPPKTEEPKPQAGSPFASAPAFSGDAFQPQGEALFTEMPDWLSNAMEEPSASAVTPEPITGSDALAPNVLPSWVEAMRPSDQGMSNIVAASNDVTLESRGALAGLSGVLPMGVGFTPTSKPKSYSIKLNASEEQLKHAGILEQILTAETAPVPLAFEKTLGASRGLRWSIAFILLIVTLITSFMSTRVFSTPVGVPSELSYAVAVAQAIPENSPVLVAVDYEPSRAGEMEAAATPLLDNMLLLKHPRLTFIASNESGSLLAERLITGPLAVHSYQSEVTYLNLGYLSGGQMGIRAFAQNPVSAAQLDINVQPAWTLPPLQGVTALNQFALIILITDDADTARSWVEQTEGARGAVPIVVVSSAQAAPMIQPYYNSGQVAGMVSGLYGGAIFEQQYNNGRPGMARNYWDAYSIGMLLAMLLVLGGGFVNLGLGLRDRAAMRAGK
ncbi:MAG: hypothetical protein HYU84_05355 [Chloroflexi bacterium]|nr:hypothetical protein [Chloroflexota bacterium]